MNTEIHQHYMKHALAAADEAEANGDVPVGAVVVFEGKIIGRGFNRREAEQDPTAHAEIVALQQAAEHLGSWRLEGCTLYVTLEPCPMCSGALVLSRIETVVFGCSDPKTGFLGSLMDLSSYTALNHQFDVVSGVLETECSNRLKTFFRAIRKQKKELAKKSADDVDSDSVTND